MMKNYGTKTLAILATLLFLAVFVPTVHAALKDNLVTYYSFDNTTRFNGNNVTDLQNFANGTTIGPWTSGVTGILGDAFQSSSTLNNAINVTPLQNTSFTINAWFNYKSPASGQAYGLFGLWDNSNANQRQFFLAYGSSPSTYNDRFRYDIKIGSASDTVLESTTAGSPESLSGSWHMFTIQYNVTATGSSQSLYIDGVLNRTNTSTSVMKMVASDRFRIGQQEANGNSLNGTVDEFGYWNRSLSPSEISQLYNGGAGLSYTQITGTFTLNVTSIAPSNNTQFNAQSFTINVTSSSATNFNISLFLNDVLNQTLTNQPSGTGVVTQFNFTFSNVQTTQFNWSVNLTNSVNTQTNGTFNFFIDNAIPQINQNTYPRADNTTVAYSNFTTSFNITDPNLFSWNLNLSTTAGVTLVNYSNYSLTGQTSVNVQQFVALNNFTGPLMLVLQVADGHTAQNIQFNNVDKVNNELHFDNVKVYEESKSDTLTLGYTKQKDRYTFDFDTVTPEVQKTFIVESAHHIDIVDDKYKGHLVIPEEGIWVDFEEDAISNAQVVRLSNTKVRVIVNSPVPKEHFHFHSIGQLNIVTQNFQFFSINSTDTWVTPQLAGNSTPFQLNITTNASFVNTSVTATLYVNGTAYTPTTTVGSGKTEFDYILTLPNTAGSLYSYWNFSLNGQTYSTNQRTTVLSIPDIDNCAVYTTKWLNISTRDEQSQALITTNVNYLFTITNGNYTGTYANNESNNSNFDFCFSPNGANFMTSLIFTYNKTGYNTRTYFDTSMLVDNLTDQLNLYLLGSTLGTAITVHAINPSDDDVRNILVEAYRYDVATNTDILVDTAITDSNGNVIFNLDVSSKQYTFKLYQDGILMVNTGRQTLFGTIYVYVIGSPQSSSLSNYFLIRNSMTSLFGYSNTTRLISWTYTSTMTNLSSFCLNVTNYNTSFSSSCSSSLSNTLTSLLTTNGSFIAHGYAVDGAGQSYYIDSLSVDTRVSLRSVLGDAAAYLISLFVFLFVTFLTMQSPTIMLTSQFATLILLGFLGLIPSTFLIVSMIFLGAIALIVVENN